MIGLSALRTRLPRSTRWLLVVCFVAAVIVGLMGMHTLTSSHAAPMSSSAAEMTGTPVADGHHGVLPTPAETPGQSCATCSPDAGHDAVTLMCALALLVTVLFLFVPRLAGRVSHGRDPWRSLTIARGPSPSWPPSLLELSISRT